MTRFVSILKRSLGSLTFAELDFLAQNRLISFRRFAMRNGSGILRYRIRLFSLMSSEPVTKLTENIYTSSLSQSERRLRHDPLNLVDSLSTVACKLLVYRLFALSGGVR